MRARSWWCGVAVVIAGLSGGCGADLVPGEQNIGQRCFVPGDCAPGLVCRGRICVATTVGLAPGPDQGRPDMSGQDMPGVDIGLPDQGRPDMMMPPVCRVGQRQCLGERVVETCVARPDGSSALTRQSCPDQTRCQDGVCVSTCVDRDNDGFFANCEPFDCDDQDPRVNPRQRELCGDGVDNNCDGRQDEGCMMGCCEGGCRPGTFCSQCVCQPFEPNRCTLQDQPCQVEGQIDNGFICADLFGSGQTRCIGLCTFSSPDRDLQCPTPGSVCAFEAEMGFGLCQTGCAIGQRCGDPTLGCLPFESPSSEGLCVPADPTSMLGAPCDLDRPFSCQAGAICVESSSAPGNQGICTQACRPFRPRGGDSDCDAGRFCLPLSPEIGVCRRDSGASEGQACMAVNSACKEDAVGCFPNRLGATTCQRLCRTSLGNTDCSSPMTRCQRFGGQGDVGVCARGL